MMTPLAPGTARGMRRVRRKPVSVSQCSYSAGGVVPALVLDGDLQAARGKPTGQDLLDVRGGKPFGSSVTPF
jgi:hypothetical protein